MYAPTAKKIPDCHHIARCFAPKPEKAIVCELQALGAKREAVAIIEANARLIAAAPELLDIAERMMEALEFAYMGAPEQPKEIAQYRAIRAKIGGKP